MDSIAYVEDPADSLVMSNVIKEYTRFTLNIAQKALNHQAPLYDKYNRENDRTTVEFLLDSLDPNLTRKLHKRIKENDNFPMIWIQLLKLVQSTSIERFENLCTKKKIKSCSASNYLGEDIELHAAAFHHDALELATAGQYKHNLTLSMLKIFIAAGGANNGNYQFPLRLVKKDLNEALFAIPHMSCAGADKFMVKKGLTYKDICTVAEDKMASSLAHQGLQGLTRWICKPDQSSCSNVDLSSQRWSGDSRQKGSCHKCGSLDHWKRDCPKNKSKTLGANRNTSWKTTPPPKGAKPSSVVNNQPVPKQVHNSTDFCWRELCGRWSTTHHSGTHGHKAVETTAVAHLAFAGPTTWNVPFLHGDLMYDLWDILGSHIIGCLFGA
jgi:hypothetical protein